ncbi:MAG TPA: GNAT family N-acetyltransferase [Candidatus Saccharibacteria bacterium]|nr:GNAT family N-acetyltransferase [Candidatus Saccharibacteria bacterium]HRK94081.1 GNAT family N-acetyltransferase [Candidatus Saccharibacteria bacterium]
MNIIEATSNETIDAIKRDTSAFDNYIKELKQKIAEGNVIFYGAHDGNSFVGRVCLIRVPEEQVVRDILPGQPALVALQINESARRRGIGSQLVTAVMAKARSLGYQKISLGVEAGNQAGKSLYEKLGFVYEGHNYESCWNEPDGEGGLKRVCVNALLMVKELG